MKFTTGVSRSRPPTGVGTTGGSASAGARNIGRAVVTALIVSGFGLFGAAGLAVASPAATARTGIAVGADSGIARTSHYGSVFSPAAPAAPEPAPSVTTEPTPEPSVSSEPSPVPSPSIEIGTPSPTPEVVEPPVVETPTNEVPPQRPATPPNVTVTQIPWTSILLAAGTLLLVAVSAIVLFRRGRRLPVAEQDVFIAPDKPVGEDTAVAIVTPHGSAETLAAMVATGEAMIEGGYPVDRVQDALSEIARVNGEGAAEVVVFPTAVLVSLRSDGKVETETVSVGRAPLLLFQLEALDTAVQEARKGALAPKELLGRVRTIRELPPPFNFAQRFVASVVISIGLAMLLDASLAGVILAGVLGSFVGALMLLGSRIESRYQALLVVAAAFVVALVVFLFARTSIDPGILPALVAPLVILLPGGLLTTGVIELSTGEIMAGAARLAAGAMRLVLLAFGIVAAAALVGVPSIQLDSAAQPLGILAPWIGVAAFGVGLVVYQCARPGSLPWILLVLFVAYAAQVIGGVFLGAVLSAAIGALVMTPVAVLIARQPSGPPAIVSFFPAFLLLVPGALGLAGVTSVLDGDASGIPTLTTTLATMVSITLGLLVGLGLSSLLSRVFAGRAKSVATQLGE